jgi:hypothetical protein
VTEMGTYHLAHVGVSLMRSMIQVTILYSTGLLTERALLSRSAQQGS